MRWLLPILLAGLWLAPAGCGSARAPSAAPAEPAEVSEPEPPPPPPLDRFAGARAFSDLEALVGVGARTSGSPGAEQARAYLRGELEALGLSPETLATPVPGGEPGAVFTHLAVTLPGAAPVAEFLLVAPYDSSHFAAFESVGANDGASGAALLLELARVLSRRELPYATRLVFVDGEGRVETLAGEPERPRWQGGESLAASLDEAEELERVRLLVAFHQVCDLDLRIARDLSSHRVHREEFFRAADRLDLTDAFPTQAGFESVEASHRAFQRRGVRPVVAVVDTRFGGETVPGAYAETAEDTLERCAPESLEAVGQVTLEAVETIAARLAKIDRFARSPVASVGSLEAPSLGPDAPETAPPEPDPSAEASADGAAGELPVGSPGTP